MEKLILIGAGGYAKSVIDSIDFYNNQIVGFLDEFIERDSHLGYPIIAHSLDQLDRPEDYVYFISIGDNANRKRWFDILTNRHLRIINVIDKSANVSLKATIGTGCFIGKSAIINSMARIGDDCIVNTKALMEHGTKIGSHVNLSTNSVINGDVIVGDGTFIGSSAVVIGQKTIGKWATVGAGAVVISDIEDRSVYVGIPARKVDKKPKESGEKK